MKKFKKLLVGIVALVVATQIMCVPLFAATIKPIDGSFGLLILLTAQ